ncbi:unnamed protein product [Vicia faba]|uniref:Uncharacterized protein n=1 Tax=Vicia faba TaxID=3906 RepID=A0AAV0ZKX0_VICFA|nr:unnamed protein product [Vicia faba]
MLPVFTLQPVSDEAIFNVFNSVPKLDSDGRQVFTEEGEVVRELEQKFNFHWHVEHFNHETDHYIVKAGQLNTGDQASYDQLLDFVAGIPPIQRVGEGRRPVVDEDEKPV